MLFLEGLGGGNASTERLAHEPRRQIPTWVLAVLAAAASGGLMAACYWPLDLHFLAWIALVPWLLVLPRLSPGATWLYGTLVGLAFYRIGLDWMFKLAGPLGGVTVVGLAVWMGLSFRVARLLMERFGRGAMVWAVPLAFTGQEILRCEGLPQLRFAFLAFGYSQSHNLWIAQIASLGGVYFVTFLLAAFNAAVACACLARRPIAWVPAGAAAAIVVVAAVVAQPAPPTNGKNMTVACVQGEDLPDRQFLAMAAEAAAMSPAPACIVLPEHTIADLATPRHPFVRGLTELARDHALHVCVGAHVDAPRQAVCPYDNVAMLFGPNGLVGTQAKAVPVPFMQDGNPARSQAVFQTERGSIGVYVCYDGIFTDIPRRVAALGAEVILVPVMDVRRWPRQELWQHADMAPFRSIELRRSTVRAASSGVSQIIDPTGRVVAQRTREAGPGTIAATVPLCDQPSVFVRGGYLFASLVAWLYLGIVAGLTLDQWGKTAGRLVRKRSGAP